MTQLSALRRNEQVKFVASSDKVKPNSNCNLTVPLIDSVVTHSDLPPFFFQQMKPSIDVTKDKHTLQIGSKRNHPHNTSLASHLPPAPPAPGLPRSGDGAASLAVCPRLFSSVLDR